MKDGEYIVLSRLPINNNAAYLVFIRATGLNILDRYYSEYEDDAKEYQYVAIGPVTKGDAETISAIIESAGGKPITLKGE